MAETIRLLHSLTASASNLVDHSLYLHTRMRQLSRHFPEYERPTATSFTENVTIQFVQQMSNYCVLNWDSGIGITMLVVDMHNDIVHKRITFHKRPLDNVAWGRAARQFIDDAPQSIDVRQTLTTYHRSIEKFSEWFSRRIRIINASDYEAVNVRLSRLQDNASSSGQHEY